MKYFIMIMVVAVSASIGAFATGVVYQTSFEAISGVNWHSFNAAHDDCEVAFKEQCKMYGGFAPKSQFR